MRDGQLFQNASDNIPCDRAKRSLMMYLSIDKGSILSVKKGPRGAPKDYHNKWG